MKSIRVFELTQKRVLVTRGTARELKEYVIAAVKASPENITLDFSEVEGIAPSFLDEMLVIIDESIGGGRSQLKVNVVNVPTRLSTKFTAVAQSHGLVASEERAGWWLLGREPSRVA
ncbi:MAG: STAS-like domain-containing protein [Chloroflexi bacterium]|nr:STAS-like domain-containing protein [Chloroflexota bacterium]